MPRHVLTVLAVSLVLLFSTSALFSWLSVHWRLPVVENLLQSLRQQETEKSETLVSNNLQLMATRLGELQAKVLQLDGLGERVLEMVGSKKPVAKAKETPGQGGPFLPTPLGLDELQHEIDRLALMVESKTDELSIIESRLLEKRVRERLLPTVLPVKDAVFGSSFGHRVDPIAGVRSMHEGLDFAADVGTPVVAAADGVVLSAYLHAEYGNMINIDHGDGLTSRYAHLSRMDVVPGRLVKRGEEIGAVGTTGRSTGPHLHFEVRMLGVAQNPAFFLKKGTEFAQLKRR
ncbi:MAG: peptidase M23 [Betaproteobacteria bacterium HGW-Betaproteobacteria-10]|nr:MAG: peptidase M23 [Betaproteobacteria bacterium HGW-Betaproteobacteria-10]